MIEEVGEAMESNNLVWMHLHVKLKVLDRATDFLFMKKMEGVRWFFLEDLMDEKMDIAEDLYWLSTEGHENLIF